MNKIYAKIEIDGNDGTGKTYFANKIRELSNIPVKDRGIFSEATLIPENELTLERFKTNVLPKIDKTTLYFILSDSVEHCQERIIKRGDSIQEEFHNVADLTYYRRQFYKLFEYCIECKLKNVFFLNRAINDIIPFFNESDLNTYLYSGKMSDEEIKQYCKDVLYPKYGIKDLFTLDFETFRKLPLVVEGESKEIRALDEEFCIIYFKPTIYSFTSNRTGIVEGSNIPRVHCSQVLCELLKKNGINHAYIDYGNGFVLSRIIKDTPNIEVVVKANHTGTSKHRYYGMNGAKVRKSHPYYAGMEITNMEPYPEPIVRFDWRNPFWEPDTHKMLADEVLGDQQADLFIDVKEARKTAAKTFAILSDFLSEHDIVCYDLCLFISEDGKTVYGEISPDCGRFRHYDLGSLDKDVWRAGGSSEQVLEKWNLLHKMICE